MRSHTRYAAEAGVARLTLDRPEIRNAITNQEMLTEIVSAIELAESDPTVTVLIITGEGSAFSAGGNVTDMAERTGMFAGDTEAIAESYRSGIQRLTTTLLSSDLVLVAAVNGPAVGAGFDLALACDLRIGAPTARFAHTFVDLGILPGDGGAWLLPRVVGWQRAAELSFTARTVDAEEAVRLGILLEVVEAERLLERVEELGRLIGSKPAHSVRLTKRLLRHARTVDLPAFLDLTAAYQAIAHSTEGHATAVTDFARRLGGS
jgi:enoyl-CoA hydratase/carnithine racemase